MVVVQVEIHLRQRQGRPRRPPLVATVQRNQRVALGGAAGARGRRVLACSVSLAACWMVVVQWGYCISSSEGGLGGLSSQLLLKGFSVLGGTASVQGGGALTSGVQRAVWLMAFKQGGLQLQQRRGRPRQPLLAMLTQRAKQAALGGAAGVHRWQSTRGQCAAAWWMVVPSSGGMALAAAREASAASSCRHACLGRPQRYSLWRPTAPSAAVVDGAE